MSGAAVTHVTSPVMFGRDAESARLDRTLEALSEGRAGLVVIGGEAGMGKTRLIDAVQREALGEEKIVRKWWLRSPALEKLPTTLSAVV